MSIPAFFIGEVVRIAVTFTDVTGVAADPTTVILKIKTPDGTTTTYSGADIVDDAGVGVFHSDYQLTQSGDHHWRFEGSGALIAASEGIFVGKTTDVG